MIVGCTCLCLAIAPQNIHIVANKKESMRKSPRVSIGLPVFNGEDYLDDSIASVLAQTYSDFELLISDNGSTDATEAICEKYAAQDSRIRYFRSEENRGASWNYNRTFEVANGEFFRWLAADDMLESTILEKSVDILDEHPDVVLCFSWVMDIDSSGNGIKTKQSTVRSNLPQPHLRFRYLSEKRASHNCEEIFGLIRSDVLRQTNLIDNYTDSDRTLLAELGLHGPFVEIEEPLFLHRIHEKSSVVMNPDPRARAAWFDPNLSRKLLLPRWRQLMELFAAIDRSPVSMSERIHCYVHMLRWMKRSYKFLGRDLIWAAKYFRPTSKNNKPNLERVREMA